MLDRHTFVSTNFGHPVVYGFLGGHDTMTKSDNQDKHDHKKIKHSTTKQKQKKIQADHVPK